MLSNLVVGVRQSVVRACAALDATRLGRLVAFALATTVLLFGSEVLAQTPTFPDITEPFSFSAMAVKIGTFLTAAMAVMAAIVVGCILAKKLLGWVGRGI